MITSFFKKKGQDSDDVQSAAQKRAGGQTEAEGPDSTAWKKAKLEDEVNDETSSGVTGRKRLRKRNAIESEEEDAAVEENVESLEAPPAASSPSTETAPASSPSTETVSASSPDTEREKPAEKPAKDIHSFFNKKPLKDANTQAETVEKKVQKLATIEKSEAPSVAPKEEAVQTSNDSNDPAPGYRKGTDPALEWVSWKAGQPVPYQVLADAFAAVADTTKRLEIIQIMSKVFRSIIVGTPDDLLPAVYLSINKIAPEYKGMELGIGESILMKALVQATGSSIAVVKSKYEECGDLGIVAQESRNKQNQIFKPKPLLTRQVFSDFKSIAATSGSKSQDDKKNKMCKLLTSAKGVEARFITASMQGKLRIGLAEQTVLVALSQAIALSGPSGAENRALKGDRQSTALEAAEIAVKAAFSEKPSYDALVPVLLQYGTDDLLSRCYLTPGIPTKPMLAKPTKGISEVLDRFANTDFVCEYKYDGERAQVHLKEDGTIEVYSRNLEDNTPKYPDIVDFLPKAVKPHVKSFVIDCEAVAFDRENNTILPFQKIQGRARKGVKLEDVTCSVCLFAFDILYLNGKPLLRENLQVRREALRDSFVEVPGMFAWTKSATKADLGGVEEIQEYLNEAVAGSTEGLMVKTLSKDASYEPSRRTFNWLKIKKDYLDGCTDSFDLVPIAGYRGRGKRTGVYGAYLLACYDEESETWQAITKIGTGFSDEDLKNLSASLDERKIGTQPSYYQFSASGPTHEPDQWFEPCQVWEVNAADLSISPVYSAAAGCCHETKGIALRFPRYIRTREDKNADQATNSDQIAQMYRNQSFIASNAKPGGEDEDDW